ncbi:uncharacterized protein A1O5_09168 [Cladophialophora psammophila CBS 110553]|uniref:Peptidase C14 caspase domain-containing protein n=1 Tax=Cladophialophora psammophila CBS 110553 TaxID=1182543 RepID=W9WI83_9EURO|nr:uncharacterized protein A1O5_09168 [Cladophialophora psammophila CBS 110553]EXJ67822.1 hypothetical protein A1O5_09168 [Cladophialophora psammophila CBS 110553]
MGRRKALLIGINYIGSQHQLQGCVDDVNNMAEFLASRGFSNHPANMVVLTDMNDPRGPYYPTAHNVLAAMNWLVSEPGCMCFLHYSGHGGQVPDEDGSHSSGFADTIVPVDFERTGQIDSSTLHRALVSALPPSCTLFILFDCCHSGSAVELPFVYRTDDDGNVNLMDNLRAGAELIGEASHLIRGDFAFDSAGEARHLLAGATSFFRGLKHQYDGDYEEGLHSVGEFEEDWGRENRSVFMFSGCKDEQTSADAFINGRHVGAMSWAFLETMKTDVDWNMSYVQILQNTRALLQQRYSQVPQLSCGYPFDLNNPFKI